EAGAGSDRVDSMAADGECGSDVIEIAIAPTPEMEIVDGSRGGKGAGFAGSDSGCWSGESRDRLVVHILNANGIGGSLWGGAVVADLAFCGDGGGVGAEIEV